MNLTHPVRVGHTDEFIGSREKPDKFYGTSLVDRDDGEDMILSRYTHNRFPWYLSEGSRKDTENHFLLITAWQLDSQTAR